MHAEAMKLSYYTVTFWLYATLGYGKVNLTRSVKYMMLYGPLNLILAWWRLVNVKSYIQGLYVSRSKLAGYTLFEFPHAGHIPIYDCKRYELNIF